MSNTKDSSIFGEFSPVPSKAWKQRIQYDLKGEDYNKNLIWQSREGIHVKPFYHRDEFENQLFGQIKGHSWKIGKHLYAGNSSAANKKALEALDSGVEVLHFSIPEEKVDCKTLLKGIDVSHTPVSFQFNFLSPKYVKTISENWQDCTSNMNFNIDVIGHLACTGNWFHSLQKDHEDIAEIIGMKTGSAFRADLSLYENAGADMVQQLGFGLAHAHEYIHHFNEKGLLKGLRKFTFKVAISGNYFFEIAKLRALKLLWDALMKEYGLDIECQIVAEPSRRNKTVYAYNLNMVRTTAECMSAILGGAHVVFNTAYDSLYKKDNAFSGRLALNQLLILKEEAYFDKVYNASEGAYYIESITKQLADKSLELFKWVEKEGGFLRFLKNGTLQKKIKESAQKQSEQFNEGDEVLVGSNKFIEQGDKMKNELELYPFVKTKSRKTLIEPIIEQRLTEALEQKRLKDE